MTETSSGSTATGEDLGLVLRLLRQKLGWSQEELARRTGISQGQIQRIEGLEVPAPSVATWRRLEETLGLQGLSIRAIGPRLRRLEAEKWWIVDLLLAECFDGGADLQEELSRGMP